MTVINNEHVTMRKVSKYKAFSGPYFAEFCPIMTKYRPEKTPYLNNFHAVCYKIKTYDNSKDTWGI